MRLSSTVYTPHIKACQEQTKHLQKKAHVLSWIRTLSLFGSAALFWLYFTSYSDNHSTLITALVLLALFVVAVRHHAECKEKLSFSKLLQRNIKEEIRYLDHYELFNDPGIRFAGSAHAYSTDMDLFVSGGLFQHLNRCSGPSAENALAELLLRPNPSELNHRQEAVDELSPDHLWRQEFRAEGQQRVEKENSRLQLGRWLNTGNNKKSFKAEKLLIVFLSLAAMGTMATAIIGWTAWNLFLFVFIFNLIWVGRSSKSIGKEHRMLGTTVGELKRYSLLIMRFNAREWKSSLLKGYRQKLAGPADSAQELERLNNLLERFDYIHNIFVSPLLNGFLLFHLHTYYKVMEWKQNHGDQLLGWLETLDQIEALASLANFRANNPEFVFAEITSDKRIFEAAQLGHPLINHQVRVCNDIEMNQKPIVVLTGSNMAGKSTFLRTLGVNMILAKAGAPVCASKLRMSDFRLFTCIKVKDSLQQNESYFYAELKRLKVLKDKINSNNDCFVLLDEILRGTNSGDKLKGSIALMSQLADRGTFGVLATHDLGVSQLAESHEQVRCLHFASQLENGELKFDYRLKPGVCQQLNATYLMTMMGIIDPP